MSYRHLEVARDAGVVTVAISNPPRHTLTAKGVEELGTLVGEIEADASVRVLVLTGGGEGVFIAHYDVGELASASERQSAGPGEAPRSEAGPRLHPFHEICLRLERLAAVTIAALNGNAAGGGCELSLACDFRLMADGPYRYGLPETGVGIIPGAGGTQRMARLLGTARALDLVLHGTLVTPAQAAALGLVHRVVPPESFRAEVARFAANLASRAPIALAAAKRAIRVGAEQPRLEDGLAIEQEEFGRTMRSKDAAGAMRAWLEGKTYQWQGK